MSKKCSALNRVQEAGEETGSSLVKAISSGVSLPGIVMLFLLGFLISCKPFISDEEEENEKS